MSAILDYFEITECSLLGISWGGYFALRAAAKEKRIKNVVAYNIMYDGLDVQLSLLGKKAKRLLSQMLRFRLKGVVNRIIKGAMEKKELAKWAIEHGMYVTGTKTPFELYMSMKKHTLKNIVKEIDQNVLLLAGEKDHYIPINHFYTLKKKLINAKVSSRLFTEAEHGEQHCQVGNYEIALNTINDWLNRQIG